jgi:hypothetical protein
MQKKSVAKSRNLKFEERKCTWHFIAKNSKGVVRSSWLEKELEELGSKLLV